FYDGVRAPHPLWSAIGHRRGRACISARPAHQGHRESAAGARHAGRLVLGKGPPAGEPAGDSRSAGIPAAAGARPRAGGRQEAVDVRPAREGPHRRRKRELGTVRRLGRRGDRAGRPERDFTSGKHHYRARRRRPLPGSRPGGRGGARGHDRRRALDLAGNPCRPAADHGGDPGQVRAADGELRRAGRGRLPQGLLSGPGNRRPRAVPRPGEAPHGGRARARRPRAAPRAGIQGRHGDRRRARGKRQRAARRDADLNYYVYYKLDPARLAELRPAILAGRDLQARGTWMGVSRSGRFAAVTNYRGAREPSAAESRGALVARFLETATAPAAYVRAIEPNAYSGFNLLAADGRELWW